jgi:hypothetical protein
MKNSSLTILLITLLFLSSRTIQSCKKKENLCENVISKGRIIGYNPCRYYTPANQRKDAGFVIEIDNGTTKDTAVAYNIPTDIFEFPSIDGFAATNGQFLYSVNIQEKQKIKFNYRFASETEKTAVLCLGSINTAPYDAAVKRKEIFMTCTSPQ